MTGLLEAAPATEAPAPPPPRRESLWARLRVDLRLARRQVRHTPGSSALVVSLVALPVALLTGLAVFAASHIGTPEQLAEFELGQTQAWIGVAGGPDPSRWQAVDQPWNNGVDMGDDGITPVHPAQPTPEDPTAALPPGIRIIPLAEETLTNLETPNGLAAFPVTVGAAWDPALEGRYELLDGASPNGPSEAMATPHLLERLGARIGDEVVLSASGEAFRITGTLRRVDQDSTRNELFLPETAADAVPEPWWRWFIPDWQPTFDEMGELNRAGFVAYARDLVLDPPPGARTSQHNQDDQGAWGWFVTGSIVAVFSGYLMVLLAGAAFSVSARRQQQALAVASSVGAGRGDIFRVVLLQGTVLGAVGGLVGLGVGLASGGVLLAMTDTGAKGAYGGSWGYSVPWALITGILVFAILIGTLSAIAPARAATRGDALSALRGSRRPARLNAKRPLWGLALIGTGVVATVAGGATIATLNTAEEIDYSSPVRAVAQLAVVFGPILFLIGVLLGGHWLLVQIARVLAPNGVAPRIAARDASANPTRVIPAFSAIAACVFIAAFAVSTLAVSEESNHRNHWYAGPLGSVTVQLGWPVDATKPSDWDAVESAGRDLSASAEPARTVLISAPLPPAWDPQTGLPADDPPTYYVARQGWDGPCRDCELTDFALLEGQVYIVAADDVETVLGTTVSQDALRAYRDGAAITSNSLFVDPDGDIALTVVPQRNVEAFWQATRTGSDGTLEGYRIERLPAELVALDHRQSFEVMISPQTAANLGITIIPQVLLNVFDEPPSEATLDRLNADASTSALLVDGSSLFVMHERGPDPMEPWLWLVVGVAIVLVIGASAVCLGLSRFERRPDDATLAAVGGGPALRRRVNAWQALIIVGIGSVTGTVAGVIPMWGLTAVYPSIASHDLPWLALGVLALGLPLLVTAAAWIIPPRRPDLTRRTAIA